MFISHLNFLQAREILRNKATYLGYVVTKDFWKREALSYALFEGKMK